MSGTESHDGLLCKIGNLHSLRGGGGAKKLHGGEGGPTKKTPASPTYNPSPSLPYL